MVKKDRQTSLDELTEDFNKTLQISVCSKTVKRKLHEEGYFGRVEKKTSGIRGKLKKMFVWYYERRNWVEEWERLYLVMNSSLYYSVMILLNLYDVELMNDIKKIV